MPNSGEVVRHFYQAVQKKDIAAARAFLSDDLAAMFTAGKSAR